VANGRQHHFGPGSTQPRRRREWSEHANGSHTGSPGHLDVFGRVSDIDGFLGKSAQPFQGQSERRGVGLSSARIVGANTDAEVAPQAEVAKLLSDAPAAATRNDTEPEIALEFTQNRSCARKQRGFLLLVCAPPKPIGHFPFCAREPSCAIDLVPIGRVMESKLASAPGNAEGEKQAEVCGRISGEGIQKRSVPIEENHARGIRRSIHRPESYQGMAGSTGKEAPAPQPWRRWFIAECYALYRSGITSSRSREKSSKVAA
jgi:hypothetical protein